MRPDFTWDHYRRMIRGLKAGRRVIFFDDAFDVDGPERLGLLRHDIDICLHAAVELAEIEHQEGVCATYFLRLNGTFYNPLSKRGAPLVRHILSLGHRIGLHFDTEAYRAAGVDDATGVRQELSILSEAFGVPVKTYSQHRPFVLGRSSIEQDEELSAGFAYRGIFTKKMKYLSDSAQNWREGDALAHLDRARHLHVLVHPIWWSDDGADWTDCLKRAARREADAIEDKADVLIDRYAAYLERRREEALADA